MPLVMDGFFSDSETPLSLEELTWLQASVILDEPPTPPPKDDDIFMKDLSVSSNSTSHGHSFSSCSSSPPATSRSSHVTSSPPRNPSPLSKKSASPATPPRSEWIYRTPKSSPSIRRTANPSPYSRPHPRPMTGYHLSPPSLSRNKSTSSTRTTRTLPDDTQSITSTSSSNPFWATILRPRARSERSVPLLKTIPSQTQIMFTPPDFSSPISSSATTPPKRGIPSQPKPITGRPPSISSTLDSVSTTNSPSSSRSESPVTPISLPSSLYAPSHRLGPGRPYQHPHHRRHRTNPETDDNDGAASGGGLVVPRLLSSSCPPSKSILTRTSSVSTKDSAHTINKSVKFAAIPIVHYNYASRGYWDLEAIDPKDNNSNMNMGINVDSMDMDDDPFANYRSRSRIGQVPIAIEAQDDEKLSGGLDVDEFRELQCATPTPERERERAKGLKRLMSLTRKPVSRTDDTTASPDVSFDENHPLPPTPSGAGTSPSGRPFISTPYALGAHPTHPQHSSVSLNSRHMSAASFKNSGNGHGGPGSASNVALPIRTAPSCESFRSSKSSAARSVRSMGSAKSTSSTRGFRAWLGRTMGWTDP